MIYSLSPSPSLSPSLPLSLYALPRTSHMQREEERREKKALSLSLSRTHTHTHTRTHRAVHLLNERRGQQRPWKDRGVYQKHSGPDATAALWYIRTLSTPLQMLSPGLCESQGGSV